VRNMQIEEPNFEEFEDVIEEEDDLFNMGD
jgi:hypothetical protein